MTGDTFQAALEAITAEARRVLPAEAIKAMEDSLSRLAASGIAEAALRPGDAMPAFALPDAMGRMRHSGELLDGRAVVIAFYRGGWCPYCSIELQALQSRLDDIAQKGARLVAISPQTPDSSLSTQEKLALAFPVLSDAGNQVARKFGIVFTLEESLRPLYRAMGADIPAANGDQSFELPVPATYIVDRAGTIAHTFVSIDYRERASPDTILTALSALAEL